MPKNHSRRNFLWLAGALPLTATCLYTQKTRGLAELKIRRVDVIPTGFGERAWVFVRVHTTEPELYGIGSATNVLETHAVIAAIEKHYAPYWLGKSADRVDYISEATNNSSYWRYGPIQNPVRAALDMALWDIKGKRAGMPVYELLGGKAREADGVPLYAHADGTTFAQAEDNTRKCMEKGYRHVRVQLGGYGGGGTIPVGEGNRPRGGPRGLVFDENVYADTIPKLFEHLRNKLGFEVKLLHDAHERLTPSTAREFAKRLEPCRLFFLEDVLAPEHNAWFESIRQATTTPLAMGEVFTHPSEWMPLITERLIDYIRCRTTMIGGITPARKIASLCETFGVRTAWQIGGENDPVGEMATWHVEMSSQAFGIHEINNWMPKGVEELTPGALRMEKGYLYGSDAPGLGIELNEAVARTYPPPNDAVRWREGTMERGVDGSIIKP